jgi:hypothetical protein
MMSLPPLFFGIQLGLLAMSGALLAGGLYGMYVRIENISPDILRRPSRGFAMSQGKPRMDRHPCNLLVELLDDAERIAATGRLLNLSTSGACFASAKVLHTGDPIVARLPALRKGANKISGHIVWSKITPNLTLYGIRLNPSTLV